MMTENEKQLVEGHLYLIRNIILNTISMNKNTEELEYNDLYQTGCEALCHAAIQYKQDKGASFPTYASIVIRHALLSQCRKASKWQGITVSLDAPLSDDKELTLSDVLKDPNDQAFSDLETRLMLSRITISLMMWAIVKYIRRSRCAHRSFTEYLMAVFKLY